MGCGTSAAVSSASKVQAITLRTKDAGSQTNVTVLVSSATSDARTEAHDARKELILQHRSQALAKARELSNNRSGYNTATYTGSGMSTPRSAYSRTNKFRGSDLGSLSDNELKSRSEVLTVDMNNSRSNLSDRSSNVRKTKVSFRNEEYNRMATANTKKRRKSYMNNTKKSASILSGGKKVHVAGSDHSESSGTNSINKQADTGYEGSVSSGPSLTALANGTKKPVNSPDFTTPDDISSKSSSEVPIIQTLSCETNPGRLSVVVSMDEQSLVHDNTLIEDSNGVSPSGIADGFSNNLSLQDAKVSEKQDLELVQEPSSGDIQDSVNIENNSEPSSGDVQDTEHIENNSGENGLVSDNSNLQTNNGMSISENPDPVISNSDENNEQLGDSMDEKPVDDSLIKDSSGENGVVSENGNLQTDIGVSLSGNPDPIIPNSYENNNKPGDSMDENPVDNSLINNSTEEDVQEGIEETSVRSEPVNSNVVVVSDSHVLAKSDSVSSMKQVVNICSSNEIHSNGITAID